jgi:hypothetical protein
VADANVKLAETLAEVSKLKKEHLTEIKSLFRITTPANTTLHGFGGFSMDLISVKCSFLSFETSAKVSESLTLASATASSASSAIF